MAFNPYVLSGITLVLIVGWLFAVLRAHSVYARAFENAVMEGTIQMQSTWTQNVSCRRAMNTLENAVKAASDMQIVLALRALERFKDDDRVREEVLPLMDYPSTKVHSAISDLLEEPDTEKGDQRRSAERNELTKLAQEEGQESISRLISALDNDKLYVTAWSLLSDFGADILDDLIDAFESPGTSENVRRRLPRVIGDIHDQRSADLLMQRLECDDPILRFNVTKALLRLRAAKPDIEVDTTAVDRALKTETNTFYRLVMTQYRIENLLFEDTVPEIYRRMCGLLADHRKRSAERIFNLLGLRYCRKKMDAVYMAFSYGSETLSGLAVEWIDNVLNPDLRALLRPILDPPDLSRLHQIAMQHLTVVSDGDDGVAAGHPVLDAVGLLLSSPIPRMQYKSLELARDLDETAETGLDESQLDAFRRAVIERAKALKDDANDILSESARKTLSAFSAD